MCQKCHYIADHIPKNVRDGGSKKSSVAWSMCVLYLLLETVDLVFAKSLVFDAQLKFLVRGQWHGTGVFYIFGPA